MLSYQTETVLPTQIVFLNNMSSLYPSLLQTLDSLGLQRNKLIHTTALTAVRAVIASQLWRDPFSRFLLLPSCLEHVIHHLQIIVAEHELSDPTDDLKSTSLIAAIMGILELPSQENHSHLWKEDSGLLSKHSFASHIKYDEDSPKPIISLWMNILISLPDWNVNNSALFLINILCSHSFFNPQIHQLDHWCQLLWKQTIDRSMV